MRAAVIVPIRNEIRGLRELATALLGQITADDEIVFVDAGSTDGSRELLLELGKRDNRIRLVEAPGAFPGHARNEGIARTQAGTIAQIDGANMPEPGWFPRIIEPILRGDADYVTGNVEFLPIPTRVLGRELDLSQVYGFSLFRETRDRFPESSAEEVMAGGASAAYRRDIWDRAGGFPEWLRYGSDPLFVEKVLQQRPRTAIARDAVLLWQIGPGLSDIARRQFKRERGRYTQAEGYVSLGWPCYVALVFAAVVIALFVPWAWWAALAVLFLGVARQALKSFRAYRTWGAGPQGSWLIVMPLFFGVHLVEVGARSAGMVSGLLRARAARRAWRQQREEYLARGPLTPSAAR